MKEMSKACLIFRTEAGHFFRNRKQVLSTFLLGPAIVLLMLCLIRGAVSDPPRLALYGAGEYRAALEESGALPEYAVFREDGADAGAEIASGRNIAAVRVEEDTVRVLYDSSLLTDTGLLSAARDCAGRIAALRVSAEDYAAFAAAAAPPALIDLSDADDVIRVGLIPFVSMLFVIVLMFTNLNTGSLATEAVAGERERGTFDMLRLSGTKVSTILAGKLLFLFPVTAGMLLLDSAALILGMRLSRQGLYAFAASAAAENPLWFIPVAVCVLGIAALSSALYLALSSCFARVRQAAAYSGAVMLALSLFSYAPNLLGSEALNYLPVSNLWAVLGNALTGRSALVYALCSTLIALAAGAAALTAASKYLERDAAK